MVHLSFISFIRFLLDIIIYILGWQVDQAILSEEDRVVIIRFGRDYVSYRSHNILLT